MAVLKSGSGGGKKTKQQRLLGARPPGDGERDPPPPIGRTNGAAKAKIAKMRREEESALFPSHMCRRGGEGLGNEQKLSSLVHARTFILCKATLALLFVRIPYKWREASGNGTTWIVEVLT